MPTPPPSPNVQIRPPDYQPAVPLKELCRRLAGGTVLRQSGREEVRCLAKGAPDQLLARAATVADAGPAPADGEFRQRYLAENQRLGQHGLR
jgi:hypothetical protein